MSKKATPNIREKAAKAALELAAAKGWNAVTLSAVARRIKVKLAELHEHCDDRFDLLAAYGRMIDRRVLAGSGDGGDSPRDRLFDLLMARFDVLNEDRDGVKAVLKSFCLDPKQAVISLPHLGRSMCWMLDAAGIETGGRRGAIRVAGLAGVYLRTLKTWVDDDSPDMAKTMAALDENLTRAEQWAQSFGL